ncbi:hypothetical protein ACS0TY_003710 [Phlomoides rotata]
MEEGTGTQGSSSSAAYDSLDPGWKYFQKIDPKNKNDLMCSFCNKVYKEGIFRAKQHLAGNYRNTAKCTKVPAPVREEIKAYMDSNNTKKSRTSNLLFHNNDHDQVLDFLDDGEESMPNEASTMDMPSQSKKQKKGHMDMFVQKTVGPRVKERQTTINEAYKKDLREKGIMAIANWMYDAAIPFNAVNYPSFQQIFDITCQHGPGFKALSFHEVRVPCLAKAVSQVEEDYITSCRAEWSKYGCSVMVDGWTDKKQRTLINFLINSPRGSVFIESVDASEYAKTGEKMSELIDRIIVKVGVENVVQIITDNASNMVLAGKLLETKRPHLYWTPCVAHCIDLMLEDIGKLSEMKMTFKKAISVTSFVYVRPGVVNMLRKFTEGKELCRAGVTRFATAFLTLKRMLELKKKLRDMFTSEDWTQSKWSKEADGKKVASIILAPRFWNSVVRIVKIYSPLVRVLRLVDGERKPAMGYIYKAMDRAKETIMKAFDNKEYEYRDAFEIIDKRWSCQLHKPLHAAGFFLNPEFFYKNGGDDVDSEVSKGFYDAMERLVPNPAEQDKITEELALYRNADGQFGLNVAIRQRGVLAPAVWWENFGLSAPHLRKFAIKVLSLTCSSSGCERNWSIFENVHAKRRNRLEQQRMNDLVFVKYNRALKRRYDARDHIDSISLKDIDESNEWVVGRMEDEEDELVFEGGDLTWGVAAAAMGVDEPTYDTRAKATKGKEPVTCASKQVEKGKGSKGKGKGKGVGQSSSSFRLRDEEEIEFDLEGEDEKDEFNEEDPQFDDDDEDGDYVDEYDEDD